MGEVKSDLPLYCASCLQAATPSTSSWSGEGGAAPLRLRARGFTNERFDLGLGCVGSTSRRKGGKPCGLTRCSFTSGVFPTRSSALMYSTPPATISSAPQHGLLHLKGKEEEEERIAGARSAGPAHACASGWGRRSRTANTECICARVPCASAILPPFFSPHVTGPCNS